MLQWSISFPEFAELLFRLGKTPIDWFNEFCNNWFSGINGAISWEPGYLPYFYSTKFKVFWKFQNMRVALATLLCKIKFYRIFLSNSIKFTRDHLPWQRSSSSTFQSNYCERLLSVLIWHRCDWIQGTDYIANPFFLSLRITRTKIKNLRWEVFGDIIQVTFCKFVTSKLANKLICNKYLDSYFQTDNVTHFPKVMKLMSSSNCHLNFSIFVLETLKFECQCSQYLEFNPICVWPEVI